MSIFKDRALLIINEQDKGALDIAGRIGLEADGLTFPVAVADRVDDLPNKRKKIIIGSSNRLLPKEFELPVLEPGYGSIAALPKGEGVVIYGHDQEARQTACFWAAAVWDGEIPAKPIIIGEKDLYAPIKEAVKEEVEAYEVNENNIGEEKPGKAWNCLSKTFSIGGLLGTSDNYFPDKTRINFLIAAGLTDEEFAYTCDFAARIGLESTGLQFPLSGQNGTVIEVGFSGEAGWIKVESGRLLIGGGDSLSENLQYMARKFPELPGEPSWISWDFNAAVDWLGFENSPESPGLLYEAQWEDKGEVCRFKKMWENEVLPALKAYRRAGDGLKVELTISEPDAVRGLLAEEIKASLNETGFNNSKVLVRPVFKQGFYWLTEEVLPELVATAPDAVTIKWRPFEIEGTRDMPLRWLQEIYPADEVLSAELGIEVNFEKVQENQNEALLLEASRGGNVVYETGLTPAAALRPYLDGYEEGQACQPTGWLKVSDLNGDPVISRRFETDLERFWNWFSHDVLTNIENLAGYEEPLFGTLSVEYRGSEPEKELGIRQEIDSPLEALHQDIYFTSLDRFAALGKKRRGMPYQAPGAILPWLQSEPGQAPRARVIVSKPPVRKKNELSITAFNPGELMLDTGRFRCRFEAPVLIPEEEKTGSNDPTTLEGVIKRLSSLPESPKDLKCRISIAARSVEGRPVFALNMFYCPEDITSTVRSALNRPTMLLNARHHGNEVSSTPAVLDLVEKLYRRPGLLKRFNLVIVPFENVDGAYIHKQMAETNPNWKLHAARYNRDGAEFYTEYFNPHSVYGETKALSRMWWDWLPDLVLDAHGIPSHEWIQFFSGYNSPPRFPISYWLPNALFYGILYETDNAGNTAAGLDLAGSITRRIKKDQPVSKANWEWLECYLKYGHQNLPKMFPLEKLDGIIFYRRKDENKMAFAANYPTVTAVHCVTEVADETATGEYLKLCSRAHRKAQEAALFWLARLFREKEFNYQNLGQGVYWRSYNRIRCQHYMAP